MNSSESTSSEETLVNIALKQREGGKKSHESTNNYPDGKVESMSRVNTEHSLSETDKTSLSYEAFQGEFKAERIQIYLPVKESSDQTISDDDSTCDDVSTIHEDDLSQIKMPLQMRSRSQDRSGFLSDEASTSTFRTRKTWKKPQTEASPVLSGNLYTAPVVKPSLFSNDQRGNNKNTGLKRYSSTGDLSVIGKQSPSTKKRQLPNVSVCKRLAASDIEDGSLSDSSESSGTAEIASASGDRKTLEAQFKLLYRENLKLDKAYGDLQDKVRSQSPQILSEKFRSPRETEWQQEKKKMKKEMEIKNEKIMELETIIASNEAKTVSPNSESTQEYITEKLNNLQQVKDAEISRLNDQVSYWLRQAYMQQESQLPSNNDNPPKSGDYRERIADLEQSEAFLQCQIINLEDQLTKEKKKVTETEKQKDDLSEHCNKLEVCLAVFDAEKSLLDDLKKQNADLRNKLAKAEENELILVRKMAQIAENSSVEEQVHLPNSPKQDAFELKEQLRRLSEENIRLTTTCTSLKDRCEGLEDLKECLSQQLKTVDEDLNHEISKKTTRIEKLNENLNNLRNERDSLLEDKEELELKQELDLNMSEKLKKRIEDLQNHIETLKSQLENQKLKIESFDDVHAQLEEASFQKSALEALCNQYKSDADELQKKILTHQGSLSDSFEKVNQHLIEETDEMAIRQQNLMTENRELRLRACSRGFDAVIAKRFYEKAVPLIESCFNLLIEEKKLSDPNDSYNRTANENDQDFSEFFPASALLSEEDAIRILNDYGDELIGTTVTELKHMQEQSPRLDDVSPLSVMIRSVIDNHKTTCILQALKDKVLLFRDYIEEKLEENVDIVSNNQTETERPPSRNLVSPNIEISSSRNAERTQLQEKIDSLQEELKTTKKVLLLVKEENQDLTLESESSKDLKNLKKELKILRENEKVLVGKLNKSQEACDTLIARTRALQEEKYELIRSSREEANVGELKEEIKRQQRELKGLKADNQALLEDISLSQNKFATLVESSEVEIEELQLEVEKWSSIGTNLQKHIEEMKKAEEKLQEKLQKFTEEKLVAENKHKEKTEKMLADINEKDTYISKLLEKIEDSEKDSSKIENLNQQLKKENEKRKDVEGKLKIITTNNQELNKQNSDLKEEVIELKVKLDQIENEKQAVYKETKKDLQEAKDQLIKVQEIEQKQKQTISELQSQIKDEDDISRRNKDLVREIDELKVKETTFLKTTEELRSQLQEFAAVKQEKTELLSEIERLRSDFSARFKQQSDKDLSLSVEELRNEVLSKTSELEKIEKLHSSAKHELDSLAVRLEDALETNRHLSAEATDANNLVEALQEKIKHLESAALKQTEQRPVVESINKTSMGTVINNSTLKPINEIVADDYDNAMQQETKRTLDSPENKALLSELECLRNKCSALELELSDFKKAQHSLVYVESSQTATSSLESSSHIESNTKKKRRKQRNSMLNEQETESSSLCETSASSYSQSSSSETEESSSKSTNSVKDLSGFNLQKSQKSQSIFDLVKENQVLAEKIAGLEIALETEEQKEDKSERVSWLEIENKRLLNILKQAEKEVEDTQNERKRLETLIHNLRSKLTEAEVLNLSGTESEPEAVYQERKRIEEVEEKKEVENLKLQLQETDCQIVAQKNKILYLEEVIQDLKQVNGKLQEYLENQERSTKLPAHPVLDQIKVEILETSLSKTSPRSEETYEDLTPKDPWTENETIPLDRVMHVLCEKVKQFENLASTHENEIAKLSISLQEAVDKLTCTSERKAMLEEQTLNLTQRLEKAQSQLQSKANEVLELEDVLNENETTSKELLQSKEEKIEKLQEQLMSFTTDFEKASSMVEKMEASRDEEEKNHFNQLNSLKSSMESIKQELLEKTSESIELMNQTQMFANQNEEAEKEMLKKQSEINQLKTELEKLQRENEETDELMKKSNLANEHLTNKLNSTLKLHDDTIEQLKAEISALEQNTNQLKEDVVFKDENLNTLSLKLQDKEEKIDLLNARVEELVETEDALKTTIDKADDMIAEREKQHVEQLEQLQDGLNRTKSDAERAEMSGDELLKEITSLEETNQKLLLEIEGLKKKENDVDYQIESIEMEKALLNTSLECEREERNELAERNTFLNKENKDLNEMNEKLNTTINNMHDQIVDLYNQCDSSAQDIKEKASVIEDMKEDLIRLQKQSGSGPRKDTPFPTGRSVETKDIQRLETELDDTRQELIMMKNVVASLRLEKDNLESEMHKMHLEHSALLPSPLPSERKDVSEQTDPYGFLSDFSLRSLKDDSYRDLAKEQAKNLWLQEESTSLRSENEVLRFKIASLEENLTAINERLVPKLELGSIADESEPKRKESVSRDDDTGRYVDEIETTRETGVTKTEILEDQLQMSEEASAKLLLQIQELEEEGEMLRGNLQEATEKNEALQAEFLGTMSDDFQTQINDLFNTNLKLKKNLERKEIETKNLKQQLEKSSNSEYELRDRYKEVETRAEELSDRLEQAEEDNHELQARLIDLDREFRNTLVQNQIMSSSRSGMKQETSEAFAQTLSLQELLQQLKVNRNEKKQEKLKVFSSSPKEDTDDDVSDIASSSATTTGVRDPYLNPIGSAAQITNLADDKLLQVTILKSRSDTGEEAFDIEDIPEPLTDSAIVESSLGGTEAQSSSNITVKSLQNEVIGCQLIIDELKRRNRELLEGTGVIMSFEEKEALEHEVSALRGQVALLERNNRIFSDRERNDLKQDLDFANKRCNNLQFQLQQIKESMEYDEVEKLKKNLENSNKLAEELREKLRAYEQSSDTSDDSSDEEKTVRHNKYARLLELEEEAEDLKKQVEEQDEDLKDRDILIEELQHKLVNVKDQYEREIDDLEKKNKKREIKLQEEVNELEREVAEKKEILKLKQDNLQSKADHIEKCEIEIENLEKEIQRKKKEIEKLKWEIIALQRENFTLKERIDRLKHSLSSASDSILIDAGISPVGTFCSPVIGSPPSRGRSRTSSLRSSFYDHDEKPKLTYRSGDSPGYSSLDNDPTYKDTPRPRRTYSFNIDDESPTSALREGIKEAKVTVNEMGDVLDTPRMTPRKRSPIPKTELSLSPLSLPNLNKENKEKSRKRLQKQKKLKSDRSRNETSESDTSDDDTCSKSSLSTTSSSVVLKSNLKPKTETLNNSETPNNEHPHISVLSLPSQNNTKTPGGSKESESPKQAGESSDSDQSSVKSKKATADLTNSFPPKSTQKRSNGDENESSGSETSSLSSDSLLQDLVDQTIGAKAKSGLPNEQISPTSIPDVVEKIDETRLNSMPLSSVHQKPDKNKQSASIGAESSTPETTKSLETSLESLPSNNISLLPDDRPTLIQEVTKARNEARKWFTEVTEADREKRELGRRLEALENELMRLKNVEDNYELIKKQQDEMRKVGGELDNVRAQLEIANRKAEEAKERNALLRAHLLDKKEAENENFAPKTNPDRQPLKPRQKSPSSTMPLSELQERNFVLKLKQTPPKSSPVTKNEPTEKQLNEIRNSFEYIAANFADLVIKNKEAEQMLTPAQKKVSKLKRKCLERDQVLAKLVLKLRKKKEDPHNESIASSTGLDSILSQADKMIQSDAVESDFSAVEGHLIPKKIPRSHLKGRETKRKDSMSSPNSSYSSLIRALNSPSTNQIQSSPTHRIYVAKHDYAPSKFTPNSSNTLLPITHSLLPDLPLLSGDTVVAIGNPDQRSDGKLYQMAEVHGKIGFVPYAYLVPAGQVEGMQSFVDQRGKQEPKKSSTSSSEKLVDLYKKLEQANIMVSDKLSRNSQNKLKQKRENLDPDKKNKSLPPPDVKTKPKKPERFSHYNKPKITEPSDLFDVMSETSEASTLTSCTSLAQSEKNYESFSPESSRKSSKKKPFKASGEVLEQFPATSSSTFRTSTPKALLYHSGSSPHSRSSSLPPRRQSSPKPDKSNFDSPQHGSPSPKHESSQRKSRSRSSSRSRNRLNKSDSSVLNDVSAPLLPHMTVPDSPTFPVIEKTMGQKSMIICWTTPLLDMISRSNNIPVIGYEISVDRKRKVQISGAYTNKAILGDLDLTQTLLIEIRTVSSVGTLSPPCEVVFTPNLSSPTPLSSKKHGSDSHNKRPSKHSNKGSKKVSSQQPPSVQRATALYDYDPAVDSPYKSQDNEVALQQGDQVLLMGSPRADGFCDVQVNSKRGIAPIAFLISSCDESFETGDGISRNKRKRQMNKRKNENSKSSFSPSSVNSSLQY